MLNHLSILVVPDSRRSPMSDPVSVGARAAAERLTPQYGPGLAADVEAALHTRGAEQRPERYFDPISLGALIVSIASLAWTIYTDLKKKTPSPAPEVVARTVRVELGKRGDADLTASGQITDVVVTEVINAADGARCLSPATWFSRVQLRAGGGTAAEARVGWMGRRAGSS
jgi:hypothetical protein